MRMRTVMFPVATTLLAAIWLVGSVSPGCAQETDIWAQLRSLPQTMLTPSVQEVKDLLTGPQLKYRAEELTVNEDLIHAASRERLSMFIKVRPDTVIITVLLPIKQTATLEQKYIACNSSNRRASFWRFYVLGNGEIVAENTLNTEYGLTSVRFMGEVIGGGMDLYGILENCPEMKEIFGQ